MIHQTVSCIRPDTRAVCMIMQAGAQGGVSAVQTLGKSNTVWACVVRWAVRTCSRQERKERQTLCGPVWCAGLCAPVPGRAAGTPPGTPCQCKGRWRPPHGKRRTCALAAQLSARMVVTLLNAEEPLRLQERATEISVGATQQSICSTPFLLLQGRA